MNTWRIVGFCDTCGGVVYVGSAYTTRPVYDESIRCGYGEDCDDIRQTLAYTHDRCAPRGRQAEQAGADQGAIMDEHLGRFFSVVSRVWFTVTLGEDDGQRLVCDDGGACVILRAENVRHLIESRLLVRNAE